MRPLQVVKPTDLIPNKQYLIQEKRPEYAYLKYKGTFIKNEFPFANDEHGHILSHFTNVTIHHNTLYQDLNLHSFWWNYYEANALEHAYIDEALRQITGDPNFIYPTT